LIQKDDCVAKHIGSSSIQILEGFAFEMSLTRFVTNM